MYLYILRRLIFLVFVTIGITAMLFVIMYFLPGDPARAAAGPGAKPEHVERIRIRLGLDQPLHIQYLTYMKNLMRGDLGNSIRTRKPVIVELRTYLPASLELVPTAMLISVLVAVPLGVLSALRPGRAADATSRLFAALGMGMPVFWVALMAQFIFYGKLDILPFGGRLSTGAVPPEHVTGFYLIDSLLAGDLALFKDAVIHLSLPALVLALPEVAVISRLTRSSMLDVLTLDYVRTARAKGLREWRVIVVHALKNALLAPLTLMGMQVGWLLAGSLFVESVFSWGGIGFLAYHAIYKRDFPVLMGVTMVMCIVFVLANLVVDILYSYLDPRISY